MITVQFNSDNNVSIHEPFADKLKSVLQDELGRFDQVVTRLEVHLSDENGHKTGVDDKKCVLEARVAGRPPIAVTNRADNHELAVYGAIDKLKSSLDSTLGKLNYK